MRPIAVELFQLPFGNSDSVVVNAQAHLIAVESQDYLGSGSFSVAMNVRQAFLQHAEESQFRGLTQAPLLAFDLKIYVDAGTLRETFNEPFCRGSQANFVSRGGCSRYDMVRAPFRLSDRIDARSVMTSSFG